MKKFLLDDLLQIPLPEKIGVCTVAYKTNIKACLWIAGYNKKLYFFDCKGNSCHRTKEFKTRIIQIWDNHVFTQTSYFNLNQTPLKEIPHKSVLVCAYKNIFATSKGHVFMFYGNIKDVSPIFTMRSDSCTIQSLGLSSDNKYVFASNGKTTKIYNMQRCCVVKVIEGGFKFLCPSGVNNKLMFFGNKKEVYVWGVDNNKFVLLEGLRNVNFAVHFPENYLLCCKPKSISIYRLFDGVESEVVKYFSKKIITYFTKVGGKLCVFVEPE